MKRNTLYYWLMVAFIICVAMSLGGCGGSSNSFMGGWGQENVSLTMSEVWQDKEAAQEVVNRLNSGDVFLLLTVRMETIEKKSDDSVTVMKYYDMVDSVFFTMLITRKYPIMPQKYWRITTAETLSSY